MSLGDADAKFPGQSLEKNIPPSPSRENPGQVYPKSDPHAAPHESVPGTGGAHNPAVGQTLSNPFVLDDAFDGLDHALAKAITAIESDTDASGGSAESETLLSKFRGWQNELVGLRRKGARGGREVQGGQQGHASQGGMFTD
ncbi:uncharacterized protein C8Q71DRAFT_569091 [Rhodofomes roseus]|uniref:Uncharacterized protein n=1 Tax=Rhodofomes roseus TaxID=34475 RepID=A0ABQ8KIW7_9APHY|nr:uncharacterized protein C8Q71DRAFT_569091 [Rhodofomes roseus]KAH9837921.1 hypothetical protein C8Q71DRAFT_569091 [Rhodofomes roseus]